MLPVPAQGPPSNPLPDEAWPWPLEALCRQLAASGQPVERDLAGLLAHGVRDASDAFRLQRYHRKIDVAHRLMASYDDALAAATSAHTVSGAGYLALALVLARSAHSEPVHTMAGRANRLRWVNSAFNALAAGDGDSPGGGEPTRSLLTCLDNLLQQTCPA
jgi:hypothetical protein